VLLCVAMYICREISHKKARKVGRRRVRPPTAPRVCVAVCCSVNLGKISHTRARKVRRGGARQLTALGCVWRSVLPCRVLHTAMLCNTL